MLHAGRIKLIRSLEHKKYRDLHGLFVAEGNRLVSALLEAGAEVELLAAAPAFLERTGYGAGIPEVIAAGRDFLERASLQRTPQECLALCRIPDTRLPAGAGSEELLLCLDNLQDPGNLGTIIRLAGWFGISDVVCSPGTADIYNPKAVQATMGAIAAVRVHYRPLAPFLRDCHAHEIPVYGTFLEGENLYAAPLTPHGVLLLGNEGKGIGSDLWPLVSHRLTIPRFGPPGLQNESLNVSAAAAIACSEFRRRGSPLQPR